MLKRLAEMSTHISDALNISCDKTRGQNKNDESSYGMAAEQNSFSAIFLSLFFNILRGAFGMRSRKHGRCQL